MKSKIPLPTDNIYKFYALFGLLLLVTSALSITWVSTSTNEKAYHLIKEYESIPKEQLNKDKKILSHYIEKSMQAYAENKKLFTKLLGYVGGIGFCLMLYGFFKWHTKIQPQQDEYFNLQLKKLRKEIEGLNTE